MPVVCYPCSFYGRACIHDVGLSVHPRPEPVCASLRSAELGCRWFEVALWRRWFPTPSPWPEWTGRLQAENAFSAVVQLMHAYGQTEAAHAAAIARDGSIAYRAYGVQGVKRGLVWFARRRNADSVASFDSEPMETTWSASR
jgi:hypothetical protein